MNQKTVDTKKEGTTMTKKTNVVAIDKKNAPKQTGYVKDPAKRNPADRNRWDDDGAAIRPASKKGK